MNSTPHSASVESLRDRRRRWIDVLLVTASVAYLPGRPWLGGLLLALSFVMPLVRHLGARRQSSSIAHLVPAEVATSHRNLLAAAGVSDAPEAADIIDAADDALLEVAALLAGRPAKGAAQRRFVAARVKVMNGVAADLRERHTALTAARAELDSLVPQPWGPDPVRGPREPEAERHGVLVGAFIVLLLPAFLIWDLGRFLFSTVVALLDGLALRVRTVGRVVVAAAFGMTTVVRQARRVWQDACVAVVGAATEAHYRVVAARLRFRLHLRRARLPRAG